MGYGWCWVIVNGGLWLVVGYGWWWVMGGGLVKCGEWGKLMGGFLLQVWYLVEWWAVEC